MRTESVLFVKTNIGIIGYGIVGQAVHSILKCEPIIFDINKKTYKENYDILNTDIVFICVPTPSDFNGFVDTFLKIALDFLSINSYNGIVVIKSTTPYEVLHSYEQQLNICFNPEFLNQNTYIKDSQNQNIILLGGEYNITNRVKQFYNEYTILDCSFEFCTLKEACDFKYTRNLYGAYKVLFWEFIQDTTGNSRKMAELYKLFNDQGEMCKVGLDGFRGFGGACFPKDVKAWDKKFNHILTNFMLEFNESLLKK